MIAAVKGAVLIPHGERKSGTCYAAWALTAEHGGNEPESGISDLTFEWIVDGKWLKLKPGKDDLVLPGVWDSLSYHLVSSCYCHQKTSSTNRSCRNV